MDVAGERYLCTEPRPASSRCCSPDASAQGMEPGDAARHPVFRDAFDAACNYGRQLVGAGHAFLSGDIVFLSRGWRSYFWTTVFA